MPCVKELARVAADYPAVFEALASFVAVDGVKVGYTEKAVAPLRQGLFQIHCEEAIKRSVRALEQLSCKYVAISETMHGEKRKGLRGRFTATLSEAIVREFLLRAGRRAEDITEDARVYTDGPKPISPCNIDFLWAPPSDRTAEIYECKNSPDRLLVKRPSHPGPTNQADNVKSQLWLILTVDQLLSDNDWSVLAACITLRSRRWFDWVLSKLSRPDRIGFYGLEDFGKDFPPVLQAPPA